MKCLARSLAKKTSPAHVEYYSKQKPEVNSYSFSLERLSLLACVPFPSSLSTDDILCHIIDVSFSQLRSKSEMKRVFINKNNPNESSRLS